MTDVRETWKPDLRYKNKEWHFMIQVPDTSMKFAKLPHQGCPSLRALKTEEIGGGITNIFEEVCQNFAQNLRRIEEISHMYVLVDLTFTDVMSSNITVYSRKNTTLTVGKKMNIQYEIM